MNILTRHVGEGVAVTILGMHGGQVRIGVYAPKEVAANREVLFAHIAREKILAGKAANDAS